MYTANVTNIHFIDDLSWIPVSILILILLFDIKPMCQRIENEYCYRQIIGLS